MTIKLLHVAQIKPDKLLDHALSKVTCAAYWCTLFDSDDGAFVSDVVKYEHCLCCLFATSTRRGRPNSSFGCKTHASGTTLKHSTLHSMQRRLCSRAEIKGAMLACYKSSLPTQPTILQCNRCVYVQILIAQSRVTRLHFCIDTMILWVVCCYKYIIDLHSALNLRSAGLGTLTTGRGRSDAMCILLLQNLSNQISSAGTHMFSSWLACSVEEKRGHLQHHRHLCTQLHAKPKRNQSKG